METLETLLGKPRKRKVGRPGELSHTTRKAYELFMYGNGDGKPIRSLHKLGELSGASPRTLEKYVDKWSRESEELSRGNAGKRGQVASVTAQVVQFQAEKVNRLKLEVDALSKELEKLPVGTEVHRDTLKLFMAALTKWEESSGFAAFAATQAALAKEMAKTAGRLAVREGDEPVKKVPGFTFDTGKSIPAIAEKSEGQVGTD